MPRVDVSDPAAPAINAAEKVRLLIVMTSSTGRVKVEGKYAYIVRASERL
jgi:hypothetical protein